MESSDIRPVAGSEADDLRGTWQEVISSWARVNSCQVDDGSGSQLKLVVGFVLIPASSELCVVQSYGLLHCQQRCLNDCEEVGLQDEWFKAGICPTGWNHLDK